MRRFILRVRLDGAALLVGGHDAPRFGGDRATARDERARPVVPASALRGALRLELERMLRGRGEPACSANAGPEPAPAECGCAVCRLFGREGGGRGTLRLEDGRLEKVAGEAAEPAADHLRPRVGVSRRSGAVVDRHLGFFETTAPPGAADGVDGAPVFQAEGLLVPRGDRDGDEELAADWKSLGAACRALRFLGGGRAGGLGWVRCELLEAEAPPGEAHAGEAGESAAAGGESLAGAPVAAERPAAGATPAAFRVVFEPLAPLHFGRGRPLAYFQPSLRHAPGSTVRGALAFALLEQGLATAGDPAFQELFGVAGGAAFGAARTAGDVPSATRRRCRPGDHDFDDLVGETLRRRAADLGVALAAAAGRVCPHCAAEKAVPHGLRAGARAPLARVRTRTALNRRTGTAMDRKLYSVETLEPVPPGGDEAAPRWTAEVRSLSPAAAALLTRLGGGEVWLGGKRSKGMGRCRVAVEPAAGPDSGGALTRCDALEKALDDGWREIANALAGGVPERFLAADRAAVALVLVEPWAPEGGLDESPEAVRGGPLAPLLPEARVLTAFASLGEMGGFGAGEARWYGAGPEVRAGESPPTAVAEAGSTWVYDVPRRALEADLAAWVERGWRGAGGAAAVGGGRFAIRGPEDDF